MTNLIIAGSNKSGTTAVFRYLGDHPSVSVSRFKESGFFSAPASDDVSDQYRKYQEQFLSKGSAAAVFVEATPQYLHGGRAVARRIRSVLPDAKLLFLLRNPADRAASYFRSSYGQSDVPTFGLDFLSFVRIAIDAAKAAGDEEDSLEFRDKAFRQELRVGQYGPFLQEFIDEFGAENILVSFFDHLQSSPQHLMRSICQFVQLDSSIYDEYVYRVENKTRMHKAPALQHIAGQINNKLEPLFNRFPALRRGGRRIYDAINVDKKAEFRLSSNAMRDLEDYFKPWNSELRLLMEKTYPDQALPSWLSQ